MDRQWNYIVTDELLKWLDQLPWIGPILAAYIAKNLMFWWRIFYNAKENWTVPKQQWEGVNWGLFSGDDESMKEQCGRIIANARKVGATTLLYPE